MGKNTKDESEKFVFNDIETPTDLVSFLKKKGGNHNYYYHYTNLDSFQKIASSGYWHISKGLKMNDQQEIQKGDYNRWEKLFMASFVYGQEENMAMWGLYSLPWPSAVRIMISKEAMRRWISETDRIYIVNNSFGNVQYTEVPDVKFEINMTDVAYIGGRRLNCNNRIQWKSDFFYTGKKPLMKDVSDRTEITGYLKNEAWQYENETRIRIELNKRVNADLIAIKVPDYIIENIKIMKGPWFDSEIENTSINTQKNNVDFEKSSFTGLVSYRKNCDFCDHVFNCRRTN